MIGIGGMTQALQDTTVLQNLQNGQIIKITKTPFTIGRLLSSDYVIDNPIISRTHCSLWKNDSGWVLRDSSTNGTVVNNNLYIHQISILKYNDVICLGPSGYTFRFLLIYPNQETTNNHSIISVNSSTSVDNTRSSNRADNILPTDANNVGGLDGERNVAMVSNNEEVICGNLTDQEPDHTEVIPVNSEANDNFPKSLITDLGSSEQPSTSRQVSQQLEAAVSEAIDLTSSKASEESNLDEQPLESVSIIEVSPVSTNRDDIAEPLQNNENNPSPENQISLGLINDSRHSSNTSIYTIPDCVEQDINSIIDNYCDPGTSTGEASVAVPCSNSCKKIKLATSVPEQNNSLNPQPSTSKATPQSTQMEDLGGQNERFPEAVNAEKMIDKEQYEKMENELMCSICSSLFIQAVTLGCSHSFCAFCIKTWKKRKSHCPICRTRISTTTRTLVLDNVVEKMVERLSAEDREQRKAAIEERKKIDTAKEQHRERRRNRRANYHHPSPPPPPPPPRIPVPMEYVDLGLITDSDLEIDSDLDEDWFDHGPRYGGYGSCFICSQPGHWANACPFRTPRFFNH